MELRLQYMHYGSSTNPSFSYTSYTHPTMSMLPFDLSDQQCDNFTHLQVIAWAFTNWLVYQIASKYKQYQLLFLRLLKGVAVST